MRLIYLPYIFPISPSPLSATITYGESCPEFKVAYDGSSMARARRFWHPCPSSPAKDTQCWDTSCHRLGRCSPEL